jgi:hypothetical protein
MTSDSLAGGFLSGDAIFVIEKLKEFRGRKYLYNFTVWTKGGK